VGIEAGPVFVGSKPGRASTGVSIGLMAGNQFLPSAAAELRLGMDYFAPPPQLIPPGGCTGQVSCSSATSQRVQIVTVALDGVVGRRSDAPSLLGLMGGGARYLDVHPGGPSGLRPFAELGGGLRITIGAAIVSLEARYQIVVVKTDAPQWTIPTTVAIRF
jgi:hypothetical protein